MVQKSKSYKNSLYIAKFAPHMGMTLMAVAATLVVLEVPHHQEHVIAPAVHHTEASNNDSRQDIRREKEETGPHYTTYGVQRTPPRAGHI